MPNRYAWIALGAGAYLAFALSLVPAATAYKLFAPNELRLSGIGGTVWSGSAALGSAGAFPLHDISWDIDALPLLIGRVSGRAQARLNDGFVDTRISASPSRIVLTELSVTTSVPALLPLIPLQGADGLLSASMTRLVLEDGWPTSAVGQLRIAQLSVPPLLPSGTGNIIPLGDYDVVFSDAGDGVAALIHDNGGPLEFSGTLNLGADRSYSLEGLATPRRDAPPELVDGLRLMTGEPNDEGKRPFSLTGSL